MAYNTPELLLVGAAQTLVLHTSNFDQKNNTECVLGPPPVDSDGQDGHYQTILGW